MHHLQPQSTSRFPWTLKIDLYWWDVNSPRKTTARDGVESSEEVSKLACALTIGDQGDMADSKEIHLHLKKDQRDPINITRKVTAKKI